MLGRFEANIPELDIDKPKEVRVGIEYGGAEGERRFDPITRIFYPSGINNYVEHIRIVVTIAEMGLSEISSDEAEQCKDLYEFFNKACTEGEKIFSNIEEKRYELVQEDEVGPEKEPDDN